MDGDSGDGEGTDGATSGCKVNGDGRVSSGVKWMVMEAMIFKFPEIGWMMGGTHLDESRNSGKTDRDRMMRIEQIESEEMYLRTHTKQSRIDRQKTEKNTIIHKPPPKFQRHKMRKFGACLDGNRNSGQTDGDRTKRTVRVESRKMHVRTPTKQSKIDKQIAEKNTPKCRPSRFFNDTKSEKKKTHASTKTETADKRMEMERRGQ